MIQSGYGFNSSAQNPQIFFTPTGHLTKRMDMADMDMGVSSNGGTQQPWVFLLKTGFLGVSPFKETPIWIILTKTITLTLGKQFPS